MINQESYDFLIWMGKNKMGLYLKVWRKHYIQIVEQKFAEFKGWV